MSVNQIRVPKDYRKIRSVVNKTPGWKLEQVKSGGGHVKVRSPQGRIVISIPCSGSDRRNLANDIHDLRRAGLNV